MAGLGDLDDLLSELEGPVDRSSGPSSTPAPDGLGDLDDLLGELDNAATNGFDAKNDSSSSSSSSDHKPAEPVFLDDNSSSSSDDAFPEVNVTPRAPSPPAAPAQISAVNELDDLLDNLDFNSPAPSQPYQAASSVPKAESSSSSSSSDDTPSANTNNNNNYSTPVAHSTARDVQYSSSPSSGGQTVEEMELLKELNTVRENPLIYANILQRDVRPNFDGMVYKNKRPEATYAVTTNEGVSAIDDAIRFLQSAPSSAGLSSANGLLKASRAAVQKIGQAATTGTYALEVIEQYGSYSGSAGEVVVYGGHTAQEFIIDMIVCDGDPSRQYRNHIMDPKRRFVGITSGNHNGPFKTMCCVVLAEGWSDK